MSFDLSKWYVDCVTAEGVVFVGYTALLRLGALEIHYSSILTCDATGVVLTRTSLRAWTPPERGDDGAYVWRSRPLSFEGRWQPIDAPLTETLLAGDDGRVEWTCHAPRARTTLTLDGRAYEGLGYVEHLALTIAPWRLPIRELRWGRVLTETQSLVWIDWCGDDRRVQLAQLDGVRLGAVRVDDDGVTDGAGRSIARFRDNRVLRSGAIGTTALSVLGRAVLASVPGSALLLDETKWRARAELGASSGWAIHEVVRWP